MQSLEELFLLAESSDVFKIEDARDTLTRLCNFFCELPYYNDMVKAIAEARSYSEEAVRKLGLFIVPGNFDFHEFPDEFKLDSLGFFNRNHCKFTGRVVYPVKDPNGFVMGLIGWDDVELPKYIDSINYGYTAKKTTLYGMEYLKDYYTSNKPVYVFEGPADRVYMIGKGYQALSLEGSSMSPYVVEILKRFGDRLVLLPDADSAGEHLVLQAKRYLPLANIYQSTIAKDIDDARKIDETAVLLDLDNALNPFITKKTLIRR